MILGQGAHLVECWTKNQRFLLPTQPNSLYGNSPLTSYLSGVVFRYWHKYVLLVTQLSLRRPV